jgi:hypothetical protein
VCLEGKVHSVTGREESETDAVPGGEGGGKNLCEEMRRKIYSFRHGYVTEPKSVRKKIGGVTGGTPVEGVV